MNMPSIIGLIVSDIIPRIYITYFYFFLYTKTKCSLLCKSSRLCGECTQRGGVIREMKAREEGWRRVDEGNIKR